MHTINRKEPVELLTRNQEQTRDAIEMGVWLGRRQAFALVAGRCSTADAECVSDIRKHKRYRTLKMTWEQFCIERLGIARATADRIVRHLEEFGPEFFTLAQLTRVTPAEYRKLKVAVRGNALLHAGEEIPIQPENGPRLAAAIEELRHNVKLEAAAIAEAAQPAVEQQTQRTAEADSLAAETEPGASVETARSIREAERSLHIALTELERLQTIPLDLSDRLRLHSLVGYGAHRFNLLQLAVRL